MINRQYILLCLVFSAVTAFAQQEGPVYFRGNHVITNPDSADYYRVIDSRQGDNFKFTEYHKDSTWIKAIATGNINDPVYIGDQTFYYKSGRVAVINQITKGRHIKTIGYYPNGILMQVIDYRNGWPQELVAYDADSLGRVHIVNGNGSRRETNTLRAYNMLEHYTMEGPYKDGLKDGLWKGTDDSGVAFEETYEVGKLISGKSKTATGEKYHYTKLYEYPKFAGNIDQFESHILPNLKNPADTANLAFFKPGLLRLSYVINEDGSVTDLTGFTKHGHAPVKIELKSELPKCEPARLRGVPINYPVPNNTDYMLRSNFSPFQVDPKLNGSYRSR